MPRRTAAVSAPFRPFVPAVRRFTVSGRQRRLHRGRRRPVRVKSASAGWGVRCRFGRGSPHRNRPDRKRLCRCFGKRYPLRKARPRVYHKLTNNCITLLQIPAGKTIRLPVFPESRSPQPFRRVFQPALRCRFRRLRPVRAFRILRPHGPSPARQCLPPYRSPAPKISGVRHRRGVHAVFEPCRKSYPP